MPSNDRGRAVPITLVLLLAIAISITDMVLFSQAITAPSASHHAEAFWQVCEIAYDTAGPNFVGVAASPLLMAALALIFLRAPAKAEPVESTESTASTASTTPPRPTSDGALRLLALLQQEGRFIDFVEEDIDGYSDDQVGAAVRAIHAGCRKALHERLRIERLMTEEDGSQIEIAAGFDPAKIRLTGNVHGQPPFQGLLQHGGWRAAQVSLPDAAAGLDPAILAPAEVEIG